MQSNNETISRPLIIVANRGYHRKQKALTLLFTFQLQSECIVEDETEPPIHMCDLQVAQDAKLFAGSKDETKQCLDHTVQKTSYLPTKHQQIC